MAKRSEQPIPCKEKNDLTVEKAPTENDAQAIARLLLGPHLSHALAASCFGQKPLGSKYKRLDIAEHVQRMHDITGKAEKGDLAMCSEMLAAQAVTLDNMFAELARRSAKNVDEYLEASERFGRLALKAQANCRATLEALAKLHQPREQTVRHVHVNEGGQAIVADQYNYHAGGSQNGKSVKQSHATEAVGHHAAVPCPDAPRQGVPITGGEGPEAMQDARRDKSRRT